MPRNLRQVIAAVSAEPADYRQKLIALKKKRQLEEAKRVLELDSNLIAFAVIITALTGYRRLDACRCGATLMVRSWPMSISRKSLGGDASEKR